MFTSIVYILEKQSFLLFGFNCYLLNSLPNGMLNV